MFGPYRTKPDTDCSSKSGLCKFDNLAMGVRLEFYHRGIRDMTDHYCITFRVKNVTVGGKTYQERYASIIENADEGKGLWSDPTSFLLIASDLSTERFAKNVVKGLSRMHDMAFIFDPIDMSACYFGAVEAEDVLLSFFPNAKKL